MPLKTNIYILKLIMLLVLFGSLSIFGLAQKDTIVPINENPEKILRKLDIRGITQNGFNFWQDKFTGHWAGIDFGLNTFLKKDYLDYETEFMNNDIIRSNSTFINLMQQSIGLQRNRNTLGLITGIGLHLQSYRLDQNTTIERDLVNIVRPKILFFDDNQKSKLSIVSLNVPLLVEYQIPVNHYDNRIYLSIGLNFGYRLSSHTKIKYRKERKEKLKVPDDYSLHDFKYGLMFRTGYRWVNVFAILEMQPLFKENKGPELTPFTFGITLMQF